MSAQRSLFVTQDGYSCVAWRRLLPESESTVSRAQIDDTRRSISTSHNCSGSM